MYVCVYMYVCVCVYVYVYVWGHQVVRHAAGEAFKTLYSNVGNKAIDEIVPSLIIQLENSELDLDNNNNNNNNNNNDNNNNNNNDNDNNNNNNNNKAITSVNNDVKNNDKV